jgi:uncharacterized membrane protein YgdD (TMEM256/DUF423 family)
MKQIILIIAAFYGLLSVILGAFGAHLFKSILSIDKLNSINIANKYQMYHAILLIILGFLLNFNLPIEKYIVWFLIIGTALFSFSIYLLAFSDYWNVNLKFLGPITPIGGLLMISGWALLLFYFIKHYKYI